ncbi:hypothetical protein KORDIASMS9_02407 [Kordia sp. SMS9]|uniref:hypothetical protein n=1 Tax=Kordia sp. SMS9 TaxID=2282170 RepID=UPI000E0D531C|nr:hypothetical protein [Kordia sp. SMS9]AXG70168.1 hypothetical protein KORDIASMS9_02407 [Kordia sp. SMS9]
MSYYETPQTKSEEGVFINYSNGYYTFIFSFEEKIIFEEISKNVLDEFNLQDGSMLHKTFEVTYEEIINDLDDDDFIIFKLLGLELIDEK